MRTLRALAALTFIPLQAFAADELPQELLLRCEGTMNAVADMSEPQTHSGSFNINLRLWDGSIVDVQSGVVEGAECV